ncbi:hypothetical protein [Salininema proteolyticum]|uniref:Uncharacterized protein n=1 Tax=Salininema proteolyticum TaxID=1607685 RepID=A0ABV8U2E7_9ACTN
MPVILSRLTLAGFQIQIVKRSAKTLLWVTVNGRTAAHVSPSGRWILPVRGWAMSSDIADRLIGEAVRAQARYADYLSTTGRAA